MSKESQKFKEELKALFIKNKESFPEIEDDMFDTILHYSYEASEDTFERSMYTKEQLIETTLYFISAAATHTMLLTTTYGLDAVQEADEVFKRLLESIWKESIK